MHLQKNLLIVGSTGRNVGKTEFLCRVIRSTSQKHPVYAVKVSVVAPDRPQNEQKSRNITNGIYEETRKDTPKDTSRMLRAGSRRVFYLQRKEKIAEGFLEIAQQIPQNAAIVCESNSLAHYLRPGLFLVIRPESRKLTPKEARRTRHADMTISSDGHSFFSHPEPYFTCGTWQLKG